MHVIYTMRMHTRYAAEAVRREVLELLLSPSYTFYYRT